MSTPSPAIGSHDAQQTSKQNTQQELCCLDKSASQQQQEQQPQQVNLDTNGKIIHFPTMHYIFYEYKGDFCVICREAWTKLHTNIQEIKNLPNIKITGYLSLYKAKDGIYRAGVSLDQPLPNPPADFKYEHVMGGPYVNYRLTGSFAQLTAACGMVGNLVKQNKVPIRDDGWSIENYLNDPHTTPEAELQTDIMVPTVTLDTNGKLINFPNMHYIYYEYHGDFSVVCGEAWTKLHTNLHEIKKLPNVKITGYLSLYKVKDGVYRAGVSLDQPLPNPPADFKYEHVVGGPYLCYRLTGSFTQLRTACGMVADLVKRNDIRIRADSWSIENYLDDPHVVPESQVQTDILVPTFTDENKQ